MVIRCCFINLPVEICSIVMLQTAAKTAPTMAVVKAKPTCSKSKPYTEANTAGTVANYWRTTARLNISTTDIKPTIGSVKSMRMGSCSVTRAIREIVAPLCGGSCSVFVPIRLAQRLRKRIAPIY